MLLVTVGAVKAHDRVAIRHSSRFALTWWPDRVPSAPALARVVARVDW